MRGSSVNDHVAGELRRLSSLVAELGVCVSRITELLASSGPPSPRIGVGALDPTEGRSTSSVPRDSQSFDPPTDLAGAPIETEGDARARIERAAIRLLADAPRRVWKPSDLVHELQRTGHIAGSLRGVHMWLARALRERGAILTDAGKLRLGSATPRFEQEPLPFEHQGIPSSSAPPADARPASVPADEQTSKGTHDWDSLVTEATSLLGREPNRAWRPADLCHALRDSGVLSGSLKGVHLGLVARLRKRELVRVDENGWLHPTAEATHREPPPAPVEALPVRENGLVRIRPGVRLKAPPAGEAGPPAPAVRSSEPPQEQTDPEEPPRTLDRRILAETFASEESIENRVEALEREIAEQSGTVREVYPDPLKRTAQIALWAGRARELRAAIEARGDAHDGPMQTRLRRSFRALTALVRSADSGWVDALSPAWSTDWGVYVRAQTATLSDSTPPLSRPELVAYRQALLRGLLLPKRHAAPEEIAKALRESTDILGKDDPVVREVTYRIGAGLHGSRGGWQTRSPESGIDDPSDPSGGAPRSVRFAASAPSLPKRQESAPEILFRRRRPEGSE